MHWKPSIKNHFNNDERALLRIHDTLFLSIKLVRLLTVQSHPSLNTPMGGMTVLSHSTALTFGNSSINHLSVNDKRLIALYQVPEEFRGRTSAPPTRVRMEADASISALDTYASASRHSPPDAIVNDVSEQLQKQQESSYHTKRNIVYMSYIESIVSIHFIIRFYL